MPPRLIIAAGLGIAQFLGAGVLGPAGSPREAVQAVSGFGQPIVITLIGLFILTRALDKSGVTRWMARRLIAIGGTSEPRLIGLLAGSTALLSLFMNNLAAAGLLLPSAIEISRRTKIYPSKLLIPVAFGSLLGRLGNLFHLRKHHLERSAADRPAAANSLEDIRLHPDRRADRPCRHRLPGIFRQQAASQPPSSPGTADGAPDRQRAGGHLQVWEKGFGRRAFTPARISPGKAWSRLGSGSAWGSKLQPSGTDTRRSSLPAPIRLSRRMTSW